MPRAIIALMGSAERTLDRATRRAERNVRDLGSELRVARVTRGLSQEFVASALGVSAATVSRLERGASDDASVLMLHRAAAVVGLELSARLFAGGQPLRDGAHVSLLERLRVHLGPGLTWRTEVPLPIVGDQRAWDALIRAATFRMGVEAETRPTDAQALDRRLALKQRDGGVDHVCLLLADTRHVRAVIRLYGDQLRASFPVPGRAALGTLERGGDPGGSTVILL